MMTIRFSLFVNGFYQYKDDFGDMDQMYEELSKSGHFTLLKDFLKQIEERQMSISRQLHSPCILTLLEDGKVISEDDGRKDLFLTKNEYEIGFAVDESIDKKKVAKALEKIFRKDFYSKTDVKVDANLSYSLNVKVYVESNKQYNDLLD